MASAAVVVADDGEVARGIGGNGNIGSLTGSDIGVDFKRLRHKAVHSIGAGQPQNHGLAFLDSDLIRGKFEFSCRDLDHLRIDVGSGHPSLWFDGGQRECATDRQNGYYVVFSDSRFHLVIRPLHLRRRV